MEEALAELQVECESGGVTKKNYARGHGASVCEHFDIGQGTLALEGALVTVPLAVCKALSTSTTVVVLVVLKAYYYE